MALCCAAMSSTPAPETDPLERVLDGASLVGAEVDLRYRVLGVTVEPAADRDPRGEVDDARLQVLCHPVSAVLSTLERRVDGATHLETFEADQLPDVAAAFAGATLQGPVLGRPQPQPGEWGPQFSMQGRSTAPDGRRRTLTLEVATDDARLRLFARCDTIELRDAAGQEVAPA